MLDDFDLSAFPLVATTSSARPGRRAWTVLTIYAVPAQELPGDLGDDSIRYVAEIVGETLVEGQERRMRRASFPRLAAALGWKAFDQDTVLYRDLHQKAIQWLDGHPLRGMVPVQREPHQPRTVMLDESGDKFRFVPVQPMEARPAMPDLGAAICWLYPDNGDDPRDRINQFSADFGLDAEIVAWIARVELGTISPTNGHEEDAMALSRALTLAIRHIDRESFNARVR